MLSLKLKLRRAAWGCAEERSAEGPVIDLKRLHAGRDTECQLL